MSQKTEKILDRLEKMLAHQNSAEEIGNVEEAAAFAGKINELLLKYNLTMSQVEFRKLIDKSPIDKEQVRGRDFWKGAEDGCQRWAPGESLGSVVAEAHLCRILVHSKSANITFVGRKHNRQLAVWMFTYLTRTAYKLERKAYREERRLGHDTSNFRASYWDGFIAEIRKRYRDERDRINAQKHSKNALVRLTDEGQAVQDWIDDNPAFNKVPAARGRRGFNGNAYAAGARDGKKVPIRSNAVEQKSGSGKALAS